MEPHIKVSRIHRGLSWLFALLTLMLLPLPLSTLLSDGNISLSTLAPALIFPGGTFSACLFHYFVGRGARDRKRWARVASMCIAVLMLFAVPLGTIIGTYLLVNRAWPPVASNDTPRSSPVEEQGDSRSSFAPVGAGEVQTVEDQMGDRRLLRALVLIDVAATVVGVTAGIALESSLPEPLRNYVATEEPSTFFLSAGLILLILMIVAWVGVWRQSSWARKAYAAMWLGSLALIPFGGSYVHSGIDEALDFVSTSAGGAILAVLFLATSQRADAKTTTNETAKGHS